MNNDGCSIFECGDHYNLHQCDHIKNNILVQVHVSRPSSPMPSAGADSIADNSDENPANEYMQSIARCLQMMLRVDEYRFAFVSVDGISTLLQVLSGRVNFQVQYQLTFCLWVLTFNPVLAEKMNKFNVIPILADILSDSVKEKVTRIILAVFR
ncbi:hypothetical protein J437_LFUL011204, partial [Ladona fulva]